MSRVISAAPTPTHRGRLFTNTIFLALLFLLLTTVAMFFYRGGTLVDPNHPGYDFFRNFFSDLGLFTAHNGESNMVSAALFFLGLNAGGLGLILFFLGFRRLFSSGPLSRVLSIVGTIAGILAGLGFMGVAFSPADLLPGIHILSVQVAFLSFFAATLLYILPLLRRRDYPSRYAVVFFLFAILLGGYVYLLFYGPGLDDTNGLVIQVTAQKTIAYATVVVTLIEAWGARRFVQRLPAGS